MFPLFNKPYYLRSIIILLIAIHSKSNLQNFEITRVELMFDIGIYTIVCKSNEKNGKIRMY